MKKATFLIILISISLISKAQTFHSIAIKGGTSIANQNWDYNSDDVDEKPSEKLGFYIGINTELLRKKHFSLTLDAAYVQKGVVIKTPYQNAETPVNPSLIKEYSDIFNVLTFYPAIKYRYDLSKFSPYVFVGPRMDVHLISATLTEYDGQSYADVTLGLAYGLGMEYTLSKYSILIEAQHQPDFTSSYESQTLNSNYYLNKTNKAFIINVGLRYNL